MGLVLHDDVPFSGPVGEAVNGEAPGPRPAEDFSLVLGGPLYRGYLRGGLLRPPVDLVERRIVAFVVLTWLPLLLLTLLEGSALGGVKVPFLLDVDVHIRFLVALPLLISAELLVHQRIRTTVGQFISRGIVAPADRGRFEEIVGSTVRLRNSVAIELALLFGSFTLGYWIWRDNLSLYVDTWYFTLGAEGGRHHTAAGWWYGLVSLGVFRFVLFRWYFRLAVWYVFLWRVARLPLRLNPLHPDRAGGLGFLGNSVFAFQPLLIAHTAFLAGVIFNEIWHENMKLPAFQLEIAGSVGLLMAMALLPLTFFIVRLAAAKREGSRLYGHLAMRYADEFRDKWLQGKSPAGEPLVGSADIQSLADLGGSYDTLREMGFFPIGRRSVVTLAIAIALPFAPLLPTMVPLKDLMTRVIGKFL